VVRVCRGRVAANRRAKILALAKGFRGAHSRLVRTAKQQVMKALFYAYRSRKIRKGNFKRLWICRINAVSKFEGSCYNVVRHLMKTESIGLNLKIISQISVLDLGVFFSINSLCS
jgi:large subunit ribosomal protein L20